MGHFTKASAIRRSNSFNGTIRTVNIPLFIHGYISPGICILCSHLSVFKKLCEPFLRRYKSSLSVRCRRYIGFAKLCHRKPWRLVGYHFCIDHFGDMSVNGIKGQCRRVLFLSHDLPIWHKAKLNQCLEPVADSKCKSVSFCEQLVDCLCHLCVAECGCKEFCRSFRLITGGESTREHDDLCLVDCLGKFIYGLTDVLSI